MHMVLVSANGLAGSAATSDVVASVTGDDLFAFQCSVSEITGNLSNVRCRKHRHDEGGELESTPSARRRTGASGLKEGKG